MLQDPGDVFQHVCHAASRYQQQARGVNKMPVFASHRHDSESQKELWGMPLAATERPVPRTKEHSHACCLVLLNF